MNYSSIPNALSILRIILTVPIVMSLLNHQYFLAIILFFVAGITDGLDGWIAKRYGFQTRLGSILDPAADKLLLVSSFVALYALGIMPLWLLILIFFRDVMIVSGTVGCFLGADANNSDLLSPSKLSKFNTALQIILVLFLVLVQIYPVAEQLITIAFIIVATSTMLSGADYMWIWSEKVLLQEKRKN